ncbi:hypothetical protein Q9L58_001963 [Maublancomyces gigas]|uniref:Uncharacterized protein n=1 Tax=Discina gigas TaxID=1032678 RepID=A0ABR3GT04_9PEZI
MGLLGFNSAAGSGNLVSLCANCHEHFGSNRRPAGWVFMPTNFDFFLDCGSRRWSTSVPTGDPGTYTNFIFITTSQNMTSHMRPGLCELEAAPPAQSWIKHLPVATGPPPLGDPEDVLLKSIKLAAVY